MVLRKKTRVPGQTLHYSPGDTLAASLVWLPALFGLPSSHFHPKLWFVRQPGSSPVAYFMIDLETTDWTYDALATYLGMPMNSLGTPESGANIRRVKRRSSPARKLEDDFSVDEGN